MKVSELIDALKEFDGDLEVYLQEDPEGNGFDTLFSIGEGIWDGESMYDPEWSADDACMEREEWDDFKRKELKCVVLAP